METMRDSRTLGILAVAMLVGVGAARAAAQDQGDQVTVPFSDPSRIGTISVRVVSGSITVHGADRRDVSVTMAGAPARERIRPPSADAAGLRRLTNPGGLVVEEAHNEMTVRTGSYRSARNLELTVPRRANLKLNAVNGGAIVVDGVQGEIEANDINGPVTLTDVSGSVVAHSTNGKVLATVRQASADTPMAFTSLNGDIDVTLPAGVKANLKLRTDNGDVYSDFDVALRDGSSNPVVTDSRQKNGRSRVEIDKSISGTVNGGGPEFELRTFNGNIYLRKGGQ
jgi:Toastrack DUF4097